MTRVTWMGGLGLVGPAPYHPHLGKTDRRQRRQEAGADGISCFALGVLNILPTLPSRGAKGCRLRTVPAMLAIAGQRYFLSLSLASV